MFFGRVPGPWALPVGAGMRRYPPLSLPATPSTPSADSAPGRSTGEPFDGS